MPAWSRHHDVGKLGLVYTDGSVLSITTVGLLTGQDPYDSTSMAALALDYAPFVAAVLPDVLTVVGWKSFDTNLVLAVHGVFGTPLAGSHATSGLEPAFKSLTTCVTGSTRTPASDNRLQQTRGFFQVRNAFAPTAGQKTFLASVDATYQDLVDYLNASTALWGDAQGRKANANAELTIQFNAFLQHQRGS